MRYSLCFCRDGRYFCWLRHHFTRKISRSTAGSHFCVKLHVESTARRWETQLTWWSPFLFLFCCWVSLDWWWLPGATTHAWRSMIVGLMVAITRSGTDRVVFEHGRIVVLVGTEVPDNARIRHVRSWNTVPHIRISIYRWNVIVSNHQPVFLLLCCGTGSSFRVLGSTAFTQQAALARVTLVGGIVDVADDDELIQLKWVYVPYIYVFSVCLSSFFRPQVSMVERDDGIVLYHRNFKPFSFAIYLHAAQRTAEYKRWR